MDTAGGAWPVTNRTPTVAGSHRLVREANERSILDILRCNGALSRPEIARLTGLSKPTVSLALSVLERSEQVVAVGAESGKPGPAAVIYGANPKAGFVLALDIGRRYVRSAIADLAGVIVCQLEQQNTSESADEILALVKAGAHKVARTVGLKLDAMDAIVVGSPGVFDPRSDRLLLADNLSGWSQPGVAAALRKLLGPDLLIENDVNLAALGEHAFGRSRDVDNFAFISVGTGVGLGIVLNGRLFRGANGAAGELAFAPLAIDQRVTGQPGDFERAVSASGVVARANDVGLATTDASEVFAAARAGDAVAQSVVATEAELIGRAVTTVVALFDPELVIIGGGLARSFDLLSNGITATVERIGPRVPLIAEGELGDHAVLMGAIALALPIGREAAFARHLNQLELDRSATTNRLSR
jgi:predicted NBD/HSP70 family sugar kinase